VPAARLRDEGAGVGVLFVGRRLPSMCGPGVEGSPEISEPRARPVMRGRKKGEGRRGAARWGHPVRERESEMGAVSERAERVGGGPSELAGPRAEKEKGRVGRAREIGPWGGAGCWLGCFPNSLSFSFLILLNSKLFEFN
jgi:hypothetical protein